MAVEQIIESIPFRFKISGNLIKKLGEESIANKNVALLELIKNSYDAGATLVEIKFANLSSATPTITISDNGRGMTSTDLENKWLNIATPNKSQTVIKIGERVPVGEKGIGRLSSESLGDQTILMTNPKNETTGYKIVFDWNKYQDKNALVNEIINDGYSLKKKKTDSGTTLEISKLKHDWNDSDTQKRLLKDLNLLHPPNSKPKNFAVNCSFKNASLKKVTKPFLDKAAYTIKASLIQGDLIKYESKAADGTIKKDNFKIDKKLTCGDSSFELYYFYRSANAFKNAINMEINTASIKDTNLWLDEYFGVKIYRDSFRVKPYGEDGDDWLSLDTGFQNNTMYPRNSNVFGIVSLTKASNPNIIDTTTREGIVYNTQFQDLQRFLKTVIQEVFVKFRSEVESHKKKARTKNASTKKKLVSIKQTAKKVSLAGTKLIDNLGSAYPQSFYTQLEQEINDSYSSNYPNGTFFLCRKLIENMIFNILEKKYPSNVALWYSTSTNSHLKLSQLITNLYLGRSNFKPNAIRYIEKFNADVGQFRKEANSTAHNIYDYLTDKAELKKFKINDLVQLLLNIYHTI